MAALLRARVEIRRRWRSWAGLVLLVAVASGSVLTLVAGARRTDSAYPRFLAAKRAAGVFIFLPDPAVVPAIEKLPETADFATATAMQPADTDLAPVVLTDRRFGRELNRFKFLEGRPLNPDRPDEVVVSFLVARHRHLHVGDDLTMSFLTGAPTPLVATFRVAGVEAAPAEFPPRSATYNLPVYLSPAFLRTSTGTMAQQSNGTVVQLAVRLHHGIRDQPAFLDAVHRIVGPAVGYTVLSEQTVNVQHALHLQAVALWLMAAFTGLASSLIFSQLLIRQAVEDGDDDATLRTLGMTSGQLFLSNIVRVVATGVTGATGAVALAALMSPLLPLGTARIAEPHPGFAFDRAVFLIGAVGVALLVGLLGAATNLHATRATKHSSDDAWVGATSALGDLATRPGLPLVASTGIRLAVQPGRGRNALPLRATITAVTIGVGAIAAAVTFGASLSRLLATPALYGVTFDADLRPTANGGDARALVPTLRAQRTVAALAIATTGIPLQAGRVGFGAEAMADSEPSLDPTVIDGRLPVAADEIMLGSRTLADLHAHIGQTIRVSAAGVTATVTMRIVGRGVLAAVQDNEQLGRGAIITSDALAAFVALAPPGFVPPPPGDVYVRFRPGVAKDRAMAAVSDQLGGPGNVSVYQPIQPGDVANFGQVGNLPEILAGLLGLIAATTLAHLLVSAVQRRRRDLAVFKSLGFLPRQLSSTIAWQATAVVVVALVVGVPLGLAAGRWAWTLVARQVGVVVQPTIPWTVIGLLLPSAMVIANLIAAAPALMAARIRPAVVLRSE